MPNDTLIPDVHYLTETEMADALDISVCLLYTSPSPRD